MRKPYYKVSDGTLYALNEEGMKFLPQFVAARLHYLSNMLEWYPDEDDEDYEAGDFDTFTYYEIQGKLSDGHYSSDTKKFISPVHMWIADNDDCERHLYIGGSACWLCPDSHNLYFDAISPDLLPERPDPKIWWCIKENRDVIKITICPSEEIHEDFPGDV